jgi:hypothetical protein
MHVKSHKEADQPRCNRKMVGPGPKGCSCYCCFTLVAILQLGFLKVREKCIIIGTRIEANKNKWALYLMWWMLRPVQDQNGEAERVGLVRML